MAWNEPGGSKDPWSGRGGEQGPPDLDEMMRKLQDRFGGLFGRRRGTGTGAAPGGFNATGLGFILGVVFLVWAVSGIYIVDEGKRGVVQRFGAFYETTGPGPHWYPRLIQSVTVVDVDSVRSVDIGFRGDEGLMLTEDENLVDIKFAVQYRVADAGAYLFNVREPDDTLRMVTESAIREVVGRSPMDFILTEGRSEIVTRAQQVVQETLDRYQTGLQITSLNMQNAQAPEQVQGAFADAVKAREDQQRLINEAETYKNEILPKAGGEAARIKQEAEAYKARVIAEAQGEANRFEKVLAEYKKAPGIMRQRLYLDALESVLARSSKVLVDTKGGNNMIYLPLDKIMQRDAAQQSAPPPVTTVEQAAPAAPVDTRGRDAQRRRELR